jgi:hypothetical protein
MSPNLPKVKYSKSMQITGMSRQPPIQDVANAASIVASVLMAVGIAGIALVEDHDAQISIAEAEVAGAVNTQMAMRSKEVQHGQNWK